MPAADATQTNTDRWISAASAWHSARVRTAISRSSASTTWKRSDWSSVRRPTATVCRVAWDVAVIGAGYVGLPLAVRFAATGTRVVCVDPDPAKVATIMAGESYVGDVTADELGPLVRDGLLEATTDYDIVRE